MSQPCFKDENIGAPKTKKLWEQTDNAYLCQKRGGRSKKKIGDPIYEGNDEKNRLIRGNTPSQED